MPALVLTWVLGAGASVLMLEPYGPVSGQQNDG